MEWNVSGVFEGIGSMFYAVEPGRCGYGDVDEVPGLFLDSWPYFLSFIIVENILLWLQKKPTYRLNDSITSISHGLLQESGRLIFRGAESLLYVTIHRKRRLLDLPWQHPSAWYLAALAFDFCYYWMHRACHEVHVLWAQHQVHHSSEEFNMAVGLRQSVLQGWCGVLFYLPLALIIPPSHFICHYQLNMLYQFWIHTTTIQSLGPLEYILNTPKHHRVHHGCNLYCLDKNYGGVLIVWDRLFGTFQEEIGGKSIVYGLVFNRPSFDVLHLQTFYNIYVFKNFMEMKTWPDRVRSIFYGPSWRPGQPRLGNDADKVNATQRMKYDVKLPFWLNAYVLGHFVVELWVFHGLVYGYVAGVLWKRNTPNKGQTICSPICAALC